MKKTHKLGLKNMHRYVKTRLGYSALPNTSLYEMVCKAIAKDGLPKPMGMSHKAWVSRNAPHLLKELGKQVKDYKEVMSEQQGVKQPKTIHDVTGKDFLQTYEWRRVRMIALKKYGARCQCCGATPASGAVMNVDHIKPRKIFPELALDPDNLQVLCDECNHGKGNWDMTDWRESEKA
jgi:5-methylcytosine-specific restriction endonuclease McrA